MPTISSFFGLIIRMYWGASEHNPPHIHVQYYQDKATINIATNELMEGHLPLRLLRYVQTWVDIHQDELLADWTLCQNGEEPFRIEPLR